MAIVAVSKKLANVPVVIYYLILPKFQHLKREDMLNKGMEAWQSAQVMFIKSANSSTLKGFSFDRPEFAPLSLTF